MDEKVLLFWGFTENPTFRGGVEEKPIQRGACLKQRAWTVCQFKGGLDKKDGGGGSVFEEG